MTVITVRFEDEDTATTWFREARKSGLVAAEAGLRRRDALDALARGGTGRGGLVISKDPGVDGWIVPPLSTVAA